jgi:hypothetical protein
MMTPAENFTTWRAELVTEFEALTNELATARSTLAAAETAHTAARDSWRDLNKFATGAVSKYGSMAGPLHSRLMHSREGLTAAERERGAGIAAVDSLTQRLADLSLAVGQIDVALTHEKVVQLSARPTAPSRRTPAPIYYDNIQMPAGAKNVG